MNNCSHACKYVDYLSISGWNVNGLGQKHRDDMFLESIMKYDINILLETWKGDSPDINISDYYSLNIRKPISITKKINKKYLSRNYEIIIA